MEVINNFSALLQLVASISLAFVAVEYSKAYAKTLYERLFKFDDYLKQTYKYCSEKLPDENTIKGLEPTTVGEHNTALDIESVKREYEIVCKEIYDFKEEKRRKVEHICQAKSMSAMCFFLFLCNLFLLFLGAIESRHQEFASATTSPFCILSSLFLIVGWARGEKPQQWKCCDFSSLGLVSGFFVVACFLSCLVGGFIKIDMSNTFRWWILLFNILLSFFNFIIFIIVIWWKINKYKKEVHKKVHNKEDGHLGKCENIARKVSDIQVTMKFTSHTNSGVQVQG
ncbi:hypothetical protein JFY64_04455 [Porphyromonas gingivalis]|uniref:hypothetical protein n=1 Tax=Porphyromonas gingivalis TaxID=837 RepID=UPI001F475FA8|nr:hypothetical protein [Porphyromonas gingivalis]MCE8191370.1 hypothetical protein [Porphyromonas gingivalis]